MTIDSAGAQTVDGRLGEGAEESGQQVRFAAHNSSASSDLVKSSTKCVTSSLNKEN